jgi:hypothetical protein
MIDRRSFLCAALGSGAALHPFTRAMSQETARKPRIAAIVTEYRENSHADVIVGKYLDGCKTLDVDFRPRVRIASLYMDQTPPTDIGREAAERHQVPIFPTIEGALTLGTGKLAVDGVLLIGEHGRYPYNELGQHMYPRRRFFEETAAVIRRAGRPVPVFNDKHLAYAWADAKWMYDTARELKVPFMAGSSIPVSWRKPELVLPAGTPLTEAVMVGYGGTESYGFHALEGLQCTAERRRGGETGVKSVQFLTGDDVWEAAERERWSWPLLRAALSRSEKPRVAAATPAEVRERTKEPEAFLVEYRDGFQAAVLMLYGFADEFLFAGRVAGKAEPASTCFWLQEGKPFGHFARLCLAVEEMFLTGKPAYPVERTLLSTGILDRVMQSRHRKGEKLETPELAIRYAPG